MTAMGEAMRATSAEDMASYRDEISAWNRIESA